MAQGYFAGGYFKEDYWNDDYWTGPGAQSGNYWSRFYWHDDYWNENFWRVLNTGDVFQNLIPQLQLTEYVTLVKTGPDIQATTPVLPLAAYNPTVQNAVDVQATTPNLPLSAFSMDVSTSGYQAGDITLRIWPDSTITLTDGAVTTLQNLPLVGHSHTIAYEGGYTVAASVDGLPLQPYPTDASEDTDVEPLPQSLSFTAYNTTAGIGQLIVLSGANLGFNTPTHAIEGASDVFAKPKLIEIPLTAWNATVFGRSPLFIPPGTWPADTSIVNANADEYPSNYEISDRSGFKVRRGGLVKEWTGLMVRPEEFERRNVQDFVRGVGDEQKGSPRPEQEDRYINEEYPDGVQIDDL